MDFAPSIDFVKIVLAEKAVDGKSITQGSADRMVVDFLLVISGRLNLVFGK